MKRVLMALFILAAMASNAVARPSTMARVDVPIVVRPPQRSGPAALAMVLRCYGADTTLVKRTDEAFDPKLGGTAIAALAATSIRLGYPSRIAEPGIDSIRTFLRLGVPPIVAFTQQFEPPGSPHYFVITRWDSLDNRFIVQDGGVRARQITSTALRSVWESGGGQALIVTPRVPRRTP